MVRNNRITQGKTKVKKSKFSVRGGRDVVVVNVAYWRQVGFQRGLQRSVLEELDVALAVCDPDAERRARHAGEHDRRALLNLDRREPRLKPAWGQVTKHHESVHVSANASHVVTPSSAQTATLGTKNQK